MQLTKRSFLYVAFALSVVLSPSLATDLQLENDFKTARELANHVVEWIRAGKIDEVWSVYSAQSKDDLISQFGNESKAKEYLKEQCSEITIDHWEITDENHEKSNDSLMITLNVYESPESKPVQVKQLLFIKESGVWKLFN
jgi:hypothetical protein